MSNINDNLKYLNVGLPEDIARLKAWGNIKEAVRLTDLRLEDETLPKAFRSCLTAQRELMLRLEADYPYSYDEAIQLVKATAPDFTEAEFSDYRDAGKIDWIFIDGKERYFNRFIPTLLKTDPDFRARSTVADESHTQGEDSDEEIRSRRESLLNRTMRLMKEKGKLSNYIRIRASVKIKDECFEPGTVRVHIPIPAACPHQSDIRLLTFSHTPTYIAPEDAAQRTVYFETYLDKNEEFFVEYSYIQTAEYIDTEKIVPDVIQPDFETHEQSPHIVFTPYIKAIAQEITEGAENNLEKARRIYDFVTGKVKYSYMRAYICLENIAESCARNFKGDCGVQALLFITLCRCCGIPAKWQSGLSAEPYSVACHDWAMFYIAPFGWLYADASFGGAAHRQGNEERRWFYFGNLDPYRMVANREFQAPLDPPKQHWRGDPYDNQIGEIEYLHRGLTWSEYDSEKVMTDYKLLD